MSLINDALKRAGQTEPPVPPPLDMMQPVFAPRPTKWPMVALPIILVSVLSLAVWFLVKGWQTARQVTASTTVAARDFTASTTPVEAPAPVPPAEPQVPTPPPIQERPSEAHETDLSNHNPEAGNHGTAEYRSAETADLRVAAVAAPTFPTLKLQSVFYSAQNPSVVINSKLLRVGDKVEQARVLAITRENVIIEWQGQTRELSLP